MPAKGDGGKGGGSVHARTVGLGERYQGVRRA